MGKRLDLTGQRFGRLVVLGFADLNNRKQRQWNCQCDCGRTNIVSRNELRSGDTKTCGKCPRWDDLVGQKFGKLTVLKFSHKIKKAIFWECQCDCGGIKTVRGSSLKIKGRGRGTKSCGCLHMENTNRKPSGVAAFNTLFCQYKHNAKKRKYLFTISKLNFRTLTQQKCHYCGTPPENKMKSGSNRNFNGTYKYNGIDRIDNNKGYVTGNVVSCCAKCNRMKMAHSQKEFLAHVERIHKHQHNSK